MTADFAQAVAQTTFEGRALAESLMTATVVVRYATGRTAQNETTGKQEPVYADRFTSVAKFQTNSLATSDIESGARREVGETMQIHLPVTTPQVHADDVIVCLTNPTDPRMVGRRFIVGAPMNKTYATATRLNVKEEA